MTDHSVHPTLPLVSVVMPNLNKGQYFRDAIESILNQDYLAIELIIVDNGSTDGSLAIAEEYSRRDNRVRLLHESKKGHTVAANTGFSHADGEFITEVGSDDVLDREKLSKQVRGLLASGAHVSYTDGWEMDSSGKSTGRIFHRDVVSHWKDQDEGGVFRELIGDRGFDEILGASIMFQRECVKYEVFDPALKFYDDWDLYVRLSRRFRFDYIPEPLYGYRIYGGNNWALLNEKSIQEAQIAVYAKWLRTFTDLDRKDKDIIVENLWARYANLHDGSGMLKLALRHRVASRLFARRIANILSCRISHASH